MSKHSVRIDSQIVQQHRWMRLMLLVLWILWVGRAFQGFWLSQLACPVFISPQSDNFYWLLHLLSIPQSLAAFPLLAMLFDSVLFLLPPLCLIYINNRFLAILLCFLQVTYHIAFNSFLTHHEHIWIGVICISFLLCFKKNNRFDVVFKAVRYYVCFIFFSAFCWKLFRGSVFQENQMQLIFVRQHMDLLILNSNFVHTCVVNFLVDKPKILNSFWYFALILESAFLMGFLTRKFDKILFFSLVLFLLGDYFVMGLFFDGFIPLAFVFVNWKGQNDD